MQNQFGGPLNLDGDTLFEIASVSKTFTATLYAALLGNSSNTVGDYIAPNGPLHISPTLADIPLKSLVNYTSGLPQDDENASSSLPPYWPQPYSLPALLSYLDACPPVITNTGEQYTYSNLGFSLMAAILASLTPGSFELANFVQSMCDQVFRPLNIGSAYFDGTSLARLPLGYEYYYGQSPVFAPIAPGWAFFPGYFGAGGIVASPNEMLQWLLFNMGINGISGLSELLPSLQQPSTTVTVGSDQLGLGWFISPAATNQPASVSKNGALDGFNSYIAFLPSSAPGVTPSQAGVFVLVNADGITSDQKNNGVFLPAALANDILLIMQGQTPPADKSSYLRSVQARSRRTSSAQ